MRTNQRSWELGSAASGSDVRSKDSTEECSKLDRPPLILLGTSWHCRMSRDQQVLRGKKKPSDGQEVVVSSCKTSKYKSRSAVSFDPGSISSEAFKNKHSILISLHFRPSIGLGIRCRRCKLGIGLLSLKQAPC